ncbi:DUF2270 domain-containing protein [Roseomonas xinghualingensis]|uniref:DUF2270 domain-containing protein n=1 Tax=Roseomonas xinghualingensis TaxID=2986475 RepID=UPI0021F0AD7A|nr:DUF2270 domain-containing protein [Roseomonas sp. SXEYE001]MCV4209203.1 DUF2270 domain-containing protein [Roseomonas sp. SXEYE001]
MDVSEGQHPQEQKRGSSGGIRLPETPGEAITVLAHFHRAEMGRMTGWRDRIDLTTNWAITVVAGMLSVSLSTPSAHHGVLLFAMVLVMLLLFIEARRYRFFDVYRTRVRRLERNYYAQVFAPRGHTEDWVRQMGEDLREPHFFISLRSALSRRLRRNYFWMFLVLLAAWILKISSSWLLQDEAPVDPAKPVPGLIQNLALGLVPGWAVLIAVCAFYCWLTYATFRPRQKAGELAHGDVHV